MEADNGSAAVEKLMRQDVDLIVTDMNMPELDGLKSYKSGPPGTEKTHTDHRHQEQK
jgi:DNA-binding NarL/FixJ family response regulator